MTGLTRERDHLRWCIETYVPDGFRDDDGVWHEGPHRRDSLAALRAYAALEAAAREYRYDYEHGEVGDSKPIYAALDALDALRQREQP